MEEFVDGSCGGGEGGGEEVISLFLFLWLMISFGVGNDMKWYDDDLRLDRFSLIWVDGYMR